MNKKDLILDKFFFGQPKKNEGLTGQLVNQETDQNHMDGTKMGSSCDQTVLTLVLNFGFQMR